MDGCVDGVFVMAADLMGFFGKVFWMNDLIW